MSQRGSKLIKNKVMNILSQLVATDIHSYRFDDILDITDCPTSDADYYRVSTPVPLKPTSSVVQLP